MRGVWALWLVLGSGFIFEHVLYSGISASASKGGVCNTAHGNGELHGPSVDLQIGFRQVRGNALCGMFSIFETIGEFGRLASAPAQATGAAATQHTVTASCMGRQY
jgi:hypothetical protein